jgi:hydroxymethylpyrimidine pyrophosphatase-like HAD family hydrolase
VRRFDLLALDVDGTLVDESGLVSPRLACALAAARDQGTRICLCTGRPLAATRAYCEQLDPTTPPVVFNGALVPSLDGGEPLVRRPLPERAVAPLVAAARAPGAHLELHTAERCYVEQMGPGAAGSVRSWAWRRWSARSRICRRAACCSRARW